MRVLSLFALVTYLIPTLLAHVAWVPDAGHGKYGVLLPRETTPIVTTTATTTSTDVSTTSVTSSATAKGNSTSTSTTESSSTTTIASLNASAPPEDDGSNSTAPGALPLEPTVTPALGISGFILIATGAILGLIGVRNLRIQVFLSSAFLTSLGVTVLIVYVMSPPVRVAIQGAYLVAVFFTGITFGALAIVFKELTEGLGCLLGGFCTSMWLLSAKPGGLLTSTDAKTGFIGAISVGFYAFSFSHYTRPYGLIVSTAIAGGTAVALGIDCYSKAGLKEFWLYLWALNDDIFPLGTNTYPVTRNIKVELAVTVIVAIMGVVSQLRLWNVVRERRAKEEEKRQEEQRQKDEAEAEAVKRLEENNLKERLEWEAKYGDHGSSTSSPSIPELPDESRKCAADEADVLEKGEAIETESITDSENSYRCSECREQEANDDAASDATGASQGSETEQQNDTDQLQKHRFSSQIADDENTPRHKVFDGAAVAKITDDKSSDVTAIVGSETGSIYSKRLSEPTPKKESAKTYSKPVSESQEHLLPDDDDNTSSTQGLVNAGSEIDSDCHTIAAESHYQTMAGMEQPATTEDSTVSADTPQPNAAEVVEPIAEKVETKVKEEETLLERIPQSQIPMEKKELHEESDLNKGDCKGEKTTPLITDSHLEEPSKETKAQYQKDSPQSTQKNAETETTAQKEDESKTEAAADDPTSIPGKEVIQEASEKKQRTVEEPPSNDQTATMPGIKETNNESPEVGGKSTEDSRPDQKAPEESSQSQDPPRTKKLSKAGSSKKKSSGPPVSKPQPKPKKEEPARLNTETVNQIPKQTSRIVMSYRTNEWAKHLADADAPELEPIQPFDEEEPNCPVEKEEVAAPVKVTELMQTPLNAQPPPAVEPRASVGKDANESHQMSNEPRLGSQKKKKRRSRSPNRLSIGSAHELSQYSLPAAQLPDSAVNSSSATLLSNFAPAEPVQDESETAKQRWKGPPPLIAVREDMMRNRLTSVSLGVDPFSRNSPGQSSTDLSRRYSSTFTILEEEGDDMPLSHRRTMLHQQSAPSPPPLANIPSAPPRRNQSGAPSRANSPAILAAWRESVREDLKEKRNPLKLSHSAITSGPGDRSPSPFGQMQQRNASSASIGDKIAEGMQRGDMSDLHREAMRRMQAKANQSANRRV